jgi:hypothetical protein
VGQDRNAGNNTGEGQNGERECPDHVNYMENDSFDSEGEAEKVAQRYEPEAGGREEAEQRGREGALDLEVLVGRQPR